MTPAEAPGVSLSGEPKLGNVYLIEERRPKASFDFFEQGLSAGCCGMLVTRELPDKVAGDRNIGDSRVIWLTNLVGEGRVNPTAIGILMSQLRSFIEKRDRSVVLVDGLEYLISLNTYDRMLQFMNQLRDVVITNNSALIVPVDPRTLSERELALLERNLEVVVPKQSDIDVQEDSLYDSQRGEIRLLDAGHR